MSAAAGGIADLLTGRASGTLGGVRWTAVSARTRGDAHGRDVFDVRELDGGAAFLVAEGASGEDGGTAAVRAVAGRFRECGTAPGGFEEALEAADMDLAVAGSDSQASAACVRVSRDGVVVTSVGDSRAWLFRDGADPAHLTAGAVPRPRIGNSGVPASRPFPRLGGGTLVVATDGFWVNASIREVDAIIRGLEDGRVAGALLAYTFRRQGLRLSDDVAIVAVRA